MEEMDTAAWAAAKGGFKALDDAIAHITGLRGAAVGPLSLSAAELAPRPGTADQVVRQDLMAQEKAARDRQTQTLEGHRKQRDAAQRQVDDAAKLSETEQLAQAFQINAARQRLTAESEIVKTMEAAEEAQKKAAAKAQELADWQAKAPERLRELQESLLQQMATTPVASQMARMRAEVLKDFEKTTPAERQARADEINRSGILPKTVADQQRPAAEAAIKGIEEAEKERQKLFQYELSKGIAKDEAVVQAMRAMSARFTENAVRMAEIGAQPGDELRTAEKIRDIRLGDIKDVANQTDAERDQKADQRRSVQLTYEETIAAINASRQRDALATGGAYQLQLRLLQQQLTTLNGITVTEGNRTDIAEARKAIEDKILDAQKNQALQAGSLQDGWRAFLLEMQKQAEEPGVILFNGLNSTLDGVSKNLAQLGGKTNWGVTFKNIGQQMNEATIRSTLQRSLGALGQKLGIGKRDGQTAAGAIFVTPAGAGGTLPTATGGGAYGGIFGGAAHTPGVFNFAGGSSGPPVIAQYFIGPVDARGADENVIYARVAQGVMAAHNAAVSNSVQATYERVQRTPGGWGSGWIPGSGGGTG
jgi:hypothetical protein